MTNSTNINAALIKNATDMQNRLLEFSHQLSNLSIKSLDGGTAYNVSQANGSIAFENVEATDSVKVTIKFVAGTGTTTDVVVELNAQGNPKILTPTIGTADVQEVAKAIAVVASNLRGVGVNETNIASIFKDGITPTSLAAVESQLKGHHDAVLQLALETLSRSTQLMQQIARKLSS